MIKTPTPAENQVPGALNLPSSCPLKSTKCRVPRWHEDLTLVPDLPGGVGTKVSIGDVGGQHLGRALDVDGDEE